MGAVPGLLGLLLGLWLLQHVLRQPHRSLLQAPLLGFSVTVLLWCGGSFLAEAFRGTPFVHALLIVKFIGVAFIGPSCIALAVRLLTHHGVTLGAWSTGAQWAGLAVGAAMSLLVITNPWHGAFLTLDGEGRAHHEVLYWVHAATGYAYVVAIVLIMRHGLRLSRSLLLRRRTLYFGLAAAFPVTVNALWLVGWLPGPVDPAPLGFAIGLTFFVLGVSRVHIVAVAPAALKDALDGAAEGFIVIDPSGDVLYSNPAARAMLAPVAVPDGADIRPICERAFSGGDVSGARALVVCGLGGSLEAGANAEVHTATDPPRWLRLSAPAVPPSGHHPRSLLLTFEDVTAAQALAAEQEQLRAQLHQVEKLGAIGQMVSGVAHELNNPLTAVAGYAELLKAQGQVAPEAEWMVRSIEEAVDRCRRIIANLMDFARRGPPATQSVNLSEIVESAYALRAYAIRTSDCAVHLQLAKDLPLCRGDKTQLQQAVLNLLNNAFDAVRDAPGRGHITLTTRESLRGPQVIVEDNGPGVPAEMRDRIFNPFFSTKGGDRPGLGLSVAYGIVETYGGTLTLDTVAPKSARFTATLPAIVTEVLPYEEPTAEDSVAPAERATPRQRRERILVVDDEQMIGDVAKRFLESAGYTVDVVSSGAAAQKAIDQDAYDAVISDIRMPGEVDGPALFRWVQIEHPDLASRLLYMTGDSVAPGTSEFLESTGVPYLAKPFTRAQYLEAVRELLEHSQSEDRLA